MKIIVGLGNLGEKYKSNRHNVGFMVVDRLVEELRLKDFGINQEWEESKKGKLQYIWFDVEEERLELIKPLTFMNDSGQSVVYAYKKHSLSPDDLYIIHDDLDIPLGRYKIQKGKGPKEHNGLLSIYESLGSKDFWHVRIGVDNRSFSPITNHRSRITARLKGEAYVLQDFTEKELEILERTIDNVTDEIFSRLVKN